MFLGRNILFIQHTREVTKMHFLQVYYPKDQSKRLQEPDNRFIKTEVSITLGCVMLVFIYLALNMIHWIKVQARFNREED